MSGLSPAVVRERVCAELEVIDAAQARLRGLSTDLVGNAFRVEVAARLETQERVTRGLSYRVFAEIADPPDGADDPGLPPGVRVIDVVRSRLAVTAAEVRRRMKVGARIRPRRSVTGPPVSPELAVLAAAVAAGAVGEDHIREVCTGLDRLPRAVSGADREPGRGGAGAPRPDPGRGVRRECRAASWPRCTTRTGSSTTGTGRTGAV